MFKSDLYENIKEYLSRLKNVADKVDQGPYSLNMKPARSKISAIDGPFVETKEILCGPLNPEGSK